MAYAGYDFSTGQGIRNYVIDRASEVDAASTQFLESLETDIMAAYIGLLEEIEAPWAKKRPPGVIVTTPEITTGTVTLTQGSTSGTFSSGPAASVAGRKIYADDDGIVCRISAHTAAATAFTLDANYPGAGGSGLAYHLFQDEYDLASDFLVPRSRPFLKDCEGAYQIDLVSEAELDSWYPYPPQQSGTTLQACAFVGDKKLRVAPWPRDYRRWEYEYNHHPGTLAFDGTANDAVIVKPAQDGVVIALLALANILVSKNDDRFTVFAGAAKDKLDKMNGISRKFQRPRLWVRSRHNVSARR